MKLFLFLKSLRIKPKILSAFFLVLANNLPFYEAHITLMLARGYNRNPRLNPLIFHFISISSSLKSPACQASRILIRKFTMTSSDNNKKSHGLIILLERFYSKGKMELW